MLSNVALGKSSMFSLNRIDLQEELDSFRQQLLSSSTSSPLSPAATGSTALTSQERQQLLSINPVQEDKLVLLAILKQWNLSIVDLQKRISTLPAFSSSSTVAPSQFNQSL